MTFLKNNPFLILGAALVALGALFLGASYLAPVSDTPEPVSDMDITYAHEGNIKFEIADTPQKRQRGLSGRTEIPDEYGMLFVFDTPERQGFWMKDMYVPIDIIWLSDRGEILGIEKSVAPETYPNVFYSPQPVRFVLETRAGFADARGWQVGDSIYLPNLE